MIKTLIVPLIGGWGVDKTWEADTPTLPVRTARKVPNWGLVLVQVQEQEPELLLQSLRQREQATKPVTGSSS